MKHADKYSGFEELSTHEPQGSFGIVCKERGSPVVVAAPHGGKIEPGTSELATAIAQDDLSLYCFEGRKNKHNRDLHISSDRFDEPQGIALMRKADRVLTVHGEGSDAEFVRIGGLDQGRVKNLRTALTEAGFNVDPPAKKNLEGTHAKNICNIGRFGAGVQLEISRGLRDALLGRSSSAGAQASTRRDAFCRAVRAGLTAP